MTPLSDKPESNDALVEAIARAIDRCQAEAIDDFYDPPIFDLAKAALTAIHPFLAERDAKVRREALEEAAKVADKAFNDCPSVGGHASMIARTIRALAERGE